MIFTVCSLKTQGILDRTGVVAFILGMKHLFIICAICFAVPVQASEPLGQTFAVCAGRYSAEMEHAWLMHDRDTAEVTHRRQQFVDLVAAFVAPEDRRESLAYRINAKLAHARLLTQATFSQDEGQSVWAKKRARFQIAMCASYLLDS